MGKSGLALSVFMGDDVFLTTSFIATERRWATRQRFTQDISNKAEYFPQ
jgi:hypothetical protein